MIILQIPKCHIVMAAISETDNGSLELAKTIRFFQKYAKKNCQFKNNHYLCRRILNKNCDDEDIKKA